MELEEYQGPPTQNFWDRHSDYFSTLSQISYVIAAIYAVVSWVITLIQTLSAGEFVETFFGLVVGSLFIGLYGIIAYFVVYLILIIITVIPYLIYRGFTQ